MSPTTFIIQPQNGYVVLQFQRGTANTLNQTMVDELRTFFQSAQADTEIGGVILTGKHPFFCAGVDLLEVFYYDSDAIRHFWGSFLQLAAEMVAFSKPLIAAITGHSPAGGCIMACACDYRVMTTGDKFQIGLNEMAVGIAPRESILYLYAFWIGERKAYQYLLEGRMLSGQEAFEDGLVDELVAAEDTLPRAIAKMEQYLKLPPNAFQQTKKALKAQLVAHLNRDFEQNLDLLHQQLLSEESQKIMGQVVAFLKSRKSTAS